MKKKNFSTGLFVVFAMLIGASRLVADIKPGGEEEYFYSTYTSFFPSAVSVSYSGEGSSYFSIKSFVFLTAIRVGDRTLSGARFWLLAAANTPIGNYNGKFTIVFKSGAQSDTLTRNVVVTVISIRDAVEENDRSMLPARYTLHQNFPNPFNPETTIAFDLPTAQQVVIRLYDLHGREITTLVNNNFPAGHHRVSWNGRDSAGRNLPSGVYLYRISAGQFTQTRKMSLLR